MLIIDYGSFAIRRRAWMLFGFLALSSVARAAGPPEKVSWHDLVENADAICRVSVVGVKEVGDVLGRGKISLNVPVTSTVITLSTLKEGCPDRFVVSWSFPGERILGRFGEQAVLFLKKTGTTAPMQWALLGGPLGAWGVEERQTEGRFTHDPLTFISPDALEGVTEAPSELFSDEKLEFRVGGQHPMYLQSHVISIYSLEHWFKERREQRGAQ
jgi:hypothetical protein